MAFAVSRSIGGISINGSEFLRNDDNTVMEFPTPETAKQFMFNVGDATEDDFADGCYNIVDLSSNEVVG